MKVGILCAGFQGWAGGVDFIRTIIESLVCLEDRDVEIHVIVPDHGPLLKAQRAVETIKCCTKSLMHGQVLFGPHGPGPALVSQTLGEGRTPARFHHIDFGRLALSATCRRLGIDVLVPAGISLGSDFPINWIGYLSDFQYKYFPENYPPSHEAKSDRIYAKLVSETKTVIVNAHAVAADAAKFLPNGSAEIIALPFAASPHADWFAGEPAVLEKYGIAARYFLIANQFWLHKRHNVAFCAFQRLAQEEGDLQLVCAGQTKDGCDQRYFPGVLSFLNEHGLSQRVRVLGLVPRRDQVELVKNCIAVVQPTSFEGGDSVYDAISLGVPTIVLDIPVNREIERWVTFYFPPGNAEALYWAMKDIARRPYLRPASDVLLELGRQRRRACGETLMSALRKSLS